VEKAKGLARSRGLSSANSLPVPTAGAGVLTKARRVENRPNTYARIWRNLALHSPAAWVIGQLHCHLRLRFDEGKLHKRFPLYPKSMNLAGAHVAAPVPAVASTSGTTNNSSEASTLVEATRATQTGALPRWIDKDIKRADPSSRSFMDGTSGLQVVMATKPSRKSTSRYAFAAFGRNKDDSSMVPGYQVVADGRKWVWRSLPPERAKTRRWMIGDKKPAPILSIDEGTMLPLEAALLGLSWCVDT